MQSQSNLHNKWENFNEERSCWKIDIKLEANGLSKLMLNLLIKNVVRTEPDYQPDKEAVEELRKAFEDSKLNTEDEPINDDNILIKLFPSKDITLSKRSKGQHLSYTEKFHIINMDKYQSLPEDEIWAIYRIIYCTFIRIQNAFKFGSLPRLSEWRRMPSKLLHSKFVQEKISHFVNQAQTQVTAKDVQPFFKNFTGVQIPSHIIIKILKQKLNYVWKRISLRVIDLNFERNEQLKVLYSVKFSK